MIVFFWFSWCAERGIEWRPDLLRRTKPRSEQIALVAGPAVLSHAQRLSSCPIVVYARPSSSPQETHLHEQPIIDVIYALKGRAQRPSGALPSPTIDTLPCDGTPLTTRKAIQGEIEVTMLNIMTNTEAVQ